MKKKDIKKEVIRWCMHYLIPSIIFALGIFISVILSILTTYNPDTNMFSIDFINIILVLMMTGIVLFVSIRLCIKYVRWLRDNSIIK